MKKILFAICLGVISFSSAAQGFDVGFSTLASLAKIEANYKINNRHDVGAFYGLGVKGLGFPHYFGGSYKYQFQKTSNNKGTIGAYVGGSLGLSYSPAYTVNVIDWTGGSTQNYASVKKFCGTAFIGTEQYVGRSEKFSSFEEIHLGYMPNYLAYALRGLFGALKGEGDTDPSKHAWWAIQVGFRIHIGK